MEAAWNVLSQSSFNREICPHKLVRSIFDENIAPQPATLCVVVEKELLDSMPSPSVWVAKSPCYARYYAVCSALVGMSSFSGGVVNWYHSSPSTSAVKSSISTKRFPEKHSS